MEPSDRVLVLNAGYEPLHRVTLKHSIRMLVRGVAEIVHVPDQTQNARARVGSEGFVLDLLDRCAGGTAVPAAPRKALNAVTAAAPTAAVRPRRPTTCCPNPVAAVRPDASSNAQKWLRSPRVTVRTAAIRHRFTNS
jgi:hypothetical protein